MLSIREEIQQGLDAARRAKTARRCGAKPEGSQSQLIQLLESKGYRLSRNSRRATCPQCSTGRTDFVVAVTLAKGLYFCHRCNKGGKIQNLAPAFSFASSPVRIRTADIKKREFQQWLDSRMKELGDRERRLGQRAALAGQVLQNRVPWPVDQMAWAVLADWYKSQRTFETFWQDATDRCGRFGLYRQWRRGKG